MAQQEKMILFFYQLHLIEIQAVLQQLKELLKELIIQKKYL